MKVLVDTCVWSKILTTDSDFLRYAKYLPIRLCGVTA